MKKFYTLAKFIRLFRTPQRILSVLFAFVFFASGQLNAQSQGPFYPGNTGDTGGGTGWTNTARIVSDNNSYATVGLAANASSQTLYGIDYGFTIPAAATINGIVVTIGRFSSGAGANSIKDVVVRLVKNGFIDNNANKADPADWAFTETAQSYGSATDLWGTTWTPAQINANNFGAALQVQAEGSARTASVDYIRITVYYAVSPTVTGFTPNNACVGTNPSVVITGTNFTGATAVNFNGTPATPFTVNSATQITTTVPAGATTGTISVTTPSGTGTSASNFTINPYPVVASITGATPANVCVGSTIAFACATPGGVWGTSNASVATVSGGTVTGVGAGTANITYTVTTSGCATVVQKSVTVNALPVVSGPSAVCAGSTIQMLPNSGGTWTSSNNAIANIDNTGLVLGVASGSATFTFTDATTNCSKTTAAVTVNAAAAITSHPNPQTICSGANTVSFSVTATGTAVSYQWYKGATLLSNAGNISGATSNTLTLNPISLTDAGNYHCEVTSALCAPTAVSNDAALVVVEEVKITAQPINTQTFCTGNSASFTLTATGTGITYQWYKGATLLVDAGSISGATTATLTINPLVTADAASNYYCIVTGTSPCGPINSSLSALVVNDAPSIGVQPAALQTACAGGSISIGTSATGGTLTYQWYKGATLLVDGGNISGATSATLTLNPTTIADNATDYYCVIQNGCAVPATTNNAAVTIYEKPFIFAYTMSVCSEDTFSLSPATGTPTVATIVPSGTKYSWSAPTVTGGITGGAAGVNLNAISGTLINPTNTPQTATYTVTPTSGTTGNCDGAPFTVTVTVNPKPFIINSSPLVCSGENLVITPANGGGNVVPVGTTYSWSAPVVSGGMTGGAGGTNQTSIALNLTNPTNTVQTASYNVTATSGTCLGTTFTIAVNVNPKPTLAADIASQSICSGDAIGAITMSNPNAVAGTIYYSWTRSNTVAVTGIAASGNTQVISGNLTNTTNTPQTVTFSLYATSDEGCISLAGTSQVIVNPKPTVSATPLTQTICSSNTISNITISNPNNVIGTTFSWSRDNTVNLTGTVGNTGSGTTISGNLTNNTSTQQTTTFTITATANGCSTAIATVSVTVNPRPDVLITSSATQTICGGTAFTAMTLSNPNGVSGTTISWTRNNTVNLTGYANNATNVTSIPAGTLINNTNTNQTTTFTVTATAAGCPSVVATVDIVVEPTPLVVATPASQNKCNAVPITAINLTTSNSLAGTTYSWTRDNTTNLTGIANGGVGNISGTLTNNTTTTQTTTFTITALAPNGCSKTITATVTVYAPLVAPIIGDNQTACVFSTPAALTMTTPISGGSGSFTYQWQRSTNGTTGWTNVGTGSTYTPGAVNNTFYYQLIVTDTAGCAPSPLTTNVILIQAVNNAGFTFNATGFPTAVCSGTTFTPSMSAVHADDSAVRYDWSTNGTYMTPATGGPVGTTSARFWFIVWLRTSSANFSFTAQNTGTTSVTVPIAITPSVYDYNGTTLGAYQCSITPQTYDVIVRPVPVANATVPNTSICSATSAGIQVTGNITDATMSYSWTRTNATVTGALSGTSGTIAIGGTYTLNNTLTNATGIDQNVTYTITPTSNGCNGTPITIMITVAPTVTPGTVTASQTICSGDTPAAFTQTVAAVGNNLTYQWQSSTTSAVGPWTNIPLATATTYAPGPITQTTWFIRVVSSTLNSFTCSVANTTPIAITVNAINPGSIVGDQTICSGSNAPLGGTGSVNATGSGTITYAWESSTVGCSGPWTPIGGATAATYTPTGITTTTYYHRIGKSTSGAVICQSASNCVTVTVNNVTAGTVASDQTLCGNNPAAFTESVAASGLGTLTYQWQISTTGCGGSWSNILGATLATYDPPAGVTVVTNYRRITTSTLNSVACTAIGNCLTVTPNSVTPGVIGSNRTVCYGGDPAGFTVTVPATGTSITYQWQVSTTGGAGPWTDIPFATGATYDEPGPMTQTSYYQCVVSATVNSSTCSAATNFVTVFVNDVTPAVIAGDQTVCGFEDPVAFTMPTPSMANGTLTYQWQSSTVGCSGPWTNVGTGPTYDPPIPSQTIYYHVISTSTLNSVVCTNVSNCITVTSNSSVWTGLVNSNWQVPGNWSNNSTPTSLNCVVIPNVTPHPIITTPAFAYNLTILNGGILQLNSNHSLTVTDAVVVQPTGQFNIKDDASLVQINNTANTGNINMERITEPMYRFDYTYWGSPLTLASNFRLGGVGGLSPNTLSDKYFSWNPTVANSFGGWNYETAATVMDPRKGYIVRAPQSFSTSPASKTPYTANFIGTPNNGDILCPIYHGTLGAGNNNDKYNLLGNPYPSAVDAEAFLSDPANLPVIDGTIYFWTHNSPPSTAYPDPFYGDFVINYTDTDYASWNRLGGTGTTQAATTGGATPSGYIAAGQGFFAKSTGTAPTGDHVIFKNSMRVSGNNNQFFRQASSVEKHRIWLNLVNANGALNQILVGYAEGATEGWDRDFDGARISETGLTLYSIIPEQNLVIQGRSLPFNLEDRVTLGCKTPVAGNYSLRIDHLDGLFENQDVYIEDRLLNVIHNLKQSPYAFASEAGTFNDRFVLRYTDNVLGTNPINYTAGMVALIANEKLQIQSSENIREILVYDLAGKHIRTYTTVATSKSFTGDFAYAQGIYLIKVKFTDGSMATHKLINSK